MAQFGDWVVEGDISTGGQGYVYRAHHREKPQETVVIKRLRNPNRSDRFAAEIKALQKIDHPHVVKLLDYDLMNNPPYAIHEWIDGIDLSKLARDALAATEFKIKVTWICQLCDAVEALHTAGLYHRDLKPENVLITKDQKRVVLCDLGLVYDEETDERVTATLEQVGSRFFLPPEAEEGLVEEVEPTVDIYSLGKVIHYILGNGQRFAREYKRNSTHDLVTLMDDIFAEHFVPIMEHSVIADRSGRFKTMQELKGYFIMASERFEQKAPVR